MRVFVTGASGWIGSATVPHLLAAGHEVAGLARSDRSAAALHAAGVEPVAGGLADLDVLDREALASDAVLHLGFHHDFSDMAGAARLERQAVETMLGALEGTGRGFALAAGVAGLTPGRLATEEDRSPHEGPDAPRGGSENLALSWADRGVRTVSLRFAPTVHGTGDHGFTAALVAIARERGVSAYVGDGSHRWAAVHASDAGRLAARALTDAPAGTAWHAVAEEGIATRRIAEAIGQRLGLPVASVREEDAPEHFGWLARFFGQDLAASSALTRERLAWEPTGPTLLADIAGGAYVR